MSFAKKYFCPKENTDYDFKCTRSDERDYIDEFKQANNIDFIENAAELDTLMQADTKSECDLIDSYFKFLLLMKNQLWASFPNPI